MSYQTHNEAVFRLSSQTPFEFAIMSFRIMIIVIGKVNGLSGPPLFPRGTLANLAKKIVKYLANLTGYDPVYDPG